MTNENENENENENDQSSIFNLITKICCSF